ncbi:ribonuclease H-like domain-containing protein, partial [Schizophyllum commune]
FEHDLLKLFVIMNVAWHAANDPYVRHFFKTWVPGARIPDRKTLSTRVLDEEVKTITDDVKVEVQQQYATGTVDGWSTKKDAIQCTGFNVNGKEYPGQLHITTPERKTSANLFEHVINDIQWMLTLGIILVAFCCDSGGDSRGLRPLLLGVMPWILTIPCWGHQIQLVVTDYVQKAGDWVAETLANCLVIINWFTGHKRALSMLLEKQRSANAPRLRSFIRAATTRWTTHYLSTRRMLDLKRMLRSLCEEHYDTLRLAGGEKEEQVEAAEKVLSIITEDRNFWSNLRVVKTYLEPLALAANIAQSSSTRLDHVLLTLATLHRTYSTKLRFDRP